MAYISFQPSDFFNTVLYTGDGNNGRTVTGLGFQPDWTWIKSRNRSDVDHILNDSTRSAGKNIYSNANYAEDTSTNKIVSFDSDGLTLNSHVSVNGSSDTYVAWNWLSNGGTTSSNTDGSITSTVQANTTSDFSVVTYTGTGATATFGHGLGTVPEMVIIKDRDAAKNWTVYNKTVGNNRSVFLNLTDGQTAPTDHWQNTTPTSSVVYIGDYSHINTSGNDYVAYCFAGVKGYSKIGTYEGNGSSNGPFVYTGFRPGFIMFKNIDGVSNWFIIDTKRNTYNQAINRLFPNTTSAEDTNTVAAVDMLSNGFKLRGTSGTNNGSGNTYIYMTFAEFPLVGSNGLAGTAR